MRMKMKKADLGINYSLRKLLQDRDIQAVVSDLYKSRKSTDVVTVFLPLANKRLAEIGFDPNHKNRENLVVCFTLNDSLLLNELFKLGVLSKEEGTDDDEGLSAFVKINSPEFIERLYEWVKDTSLIVNYGIFSLHTFTGEAYCLDNKYIFHTNKGLFRVFQAFLKEPTHILAYGKIYNIFQDSDRLTCGSETIHQIIGEVREKLQMKGKLSKLFIPSSDKYILKPS